MKTLYVWAFVTHVVDHDVNAVMFWASIACVVDHDEYTVCFGKTCSRLWEPSSDSSLGSALWPAHCHGFQLTRHRGEIIESQAIQDFVHSSFRSHLGKEKTRKYEQYVTQGAKDAYFWNARAKGKPFAAIYEIQSGLIWKTTVHSFTICIPIILHRMCSPVSSTD